MACSAFYSSPEALAYFGSADKDCVTGKSDIWSLACCLVELLSMTDRLFGMTATAGMESEAERALVREELAQLVSLA